MARLDVGIEPTDITLFFQIFAGYDVGADIQGMLQVNAIQASRTEITPTPMRKEMWKTVKADFDKLRGNPGHVVIIEVIKDSDLAITFPLPITENGFDLARSGEPFENRSAITGITTRVPMNAETCLE